MRHLGLWLRDGDRGVAAVAYREPDTAAAARRRLRPANRKVQTHKLVRHASARQTVFDLIAAVQAVGDGVLHVTGWEEAFGGPDLPERVYDLNFLRESVVEHAAAQVWWMPVGFRDTFMLRAPDTWSVVKLRMFLADEDEYVVLSPRVSTWIRYSLDLKTTDMIPARRLKEIEGFDMPGVELQPTDLQSIALLSNLRRLNLGFAPNIDLSLLSDLKHLESLHLYHTGLKNLHLITNFAKLRHLDVSHTKVHDLSPLAGLRLLEVLILYGTPVSDISPISNLSNLRWLDVEDTDLSLKDIESFQRIHPLCGVHHDL